MKLEVDLESILREANLFENPLTEKEADILRAASELFNEQGYSNSPTAEIAKRAGVTEKTLFKYFPTKENLLRRVLFPVLLRAFLPRQLQQVQKIFHAPVESFDQLFTAIFRDRFSTVKQHSSGLKMVIMEVLQNSKFRKQFSKLWVEYFWTEAIRTMTGLKDKKMIRSDADPQVITRMILYIVMGYSLTRVMLTEESKKQKSLWDDEREIQEMVRMLTRGVAPDK